MPKRNLSQRSAAGSSQSQRSVSQRTITDCFDDEENKIKELINENANKLVRYIIMRAGSNLPIRRQRIVKDVLSGTGSKKFEKVMEAAATILKEVYGYKIELCEATSSVKLYCLVNLMAPVYIRSEEEPDPRDPKKIIGLLVLSHIFMSGESCTDASLSVFLKSLNIDPSEKHEILGNVDEYIHTTMVKQKLLIVEADSHTKKSIYSWGPKAECLVSKMDVLKFVCKMYNKDPEAWETQNKLALQQLATSKIGEKVVEVMEV